MRFAFVFPGQGSQSIGMMASFGDLPIIKETFEEASSVLGIDLWELVNIGPEEALNLTVNTQPVMLTAGVAVWRAFLAMESDKPFCVAGHSLGEYTALVAAEVLSFQDALRLVKLRAEAMQNAVPTGEGGMAAILGLEDAAIIEACRQASQGEVLQAVNFNAPGQVVIAGQRAAVERGIAACKDLGAKRAILLPVSVPAHSALMEPAASSLREALAQVQLGQPAIPVLHNVDVATHQEADAIKNALITQLYRPVRWVETIRAMADQGVEVIAECGPGKVLAGLTKRINTDIESMALTNIEALDLLKQQLIS